jgi:hypothetical protein
MRRDPADPAKLQLVNARTGTVGDELGYLPEFGSPCAPGAPAAGCDPIRPEWAGQEAVANPDNWSIGMSFLHTVFVREHNIIVNEFRKLARDNPDIDSGLRNPDRPAQAISYAQVTNDELFEIARLIVAAEIAKIHTTEWTPQLLYDEPLYTAMNSNWSGLFRNNPLASEVTKRIVAKLASADNAKLHTQLYSALAAGPGIFGTASDREYPQEIMAGVNHFGVPFNFPEEFVSVYRLHPLVPDMIEFRDLSDPDKIAKHIPVIDTFRAKATAKMHEGGLSNWALSFGRQRLGLLELRNHPQFLQNLDLRPRLDTTLDVAALDIIRDREHGVPRFNEFRRQIGLRQLTSFDDFIDHSLPADSPALAAAGHRQDAARGLRPAQMRRQKSDHVGAARNRQGGDLDAARRDKAHYRLPWSGRRQHGRQCRGRRHHGRLPRRAGTSARLRDFGDPVPDLHHQRLAPAVQRPLLHLELPPRVLHPVRRRLGDEQRAGRHRDGRRQAERP